MLISIHTFNPDINECAAGGNEDCKNGASCIDKVDSFICKCAAGFDGVFCEKGNFNILDIML